MHVHYNDNISFYINLGTKSDKDHERKVQSNKGQQMVQILFLLGIES